MPAVTGRYITSDDLINSFGTTNVSVWSNLDGQGATLNTVAVTAAIAWGEAAVENKFRRSRYSVPFAMAGAPGGGWDPMLIRWMAVHAGLWLYQNRRMRQGKMPNDDRVSDLVATVGDEMNDVLAGKYDVCLGLRRGDSPSAPFGIM